MPRKVFTAGEILTAADVNTNLMDQAVMVFADSTARTAAIPTPVEGMVTYLEDVGGAQGLEVFDGAAFTPVAIEPDPPAILQVVSTTKTDAFTMSGTTFTTPTGFTASITPSSVSSKILVIVNVNVGTNLNNACEWRVRRDTTAIAVNSGSGKSGSFWNLPNADNGIIDYGFGVSHLDSPATTSAIVYDGQIRSTSTGTVALNARGSGTAGGVSSITLIEVAG